MRTFWQGSPIVQESIMYDWLPLMQDRFFKIKYVRYVIFKNEPMIRLFWKWFRELLIENWVCVCGEGREWRQKWLAIDKWTIHYMNKIMIRLCLIEIYTKALYDNLVNWLIAGRSKQTPNALDYSTHQPFSAWAIAWHVVASVVIHIF